MKDTSSRPAYLRLYEALRDQIIDGNYPYGAKLPSKRLLAEEESLSLITVEHALALLCDEGYLEARQRSGYYVRFRSSDGFVPAASAPRMLPPSTGEADFPFSVLTKTMRRVMTEYGESILSRCPNQGTLQLRQSLAQYLARSRGIHVQPEQIWIGAGAEYLYGLIVQALGRNLKYAAEDPSYSKITQVYQAHGAECELLPLGPDGIQSEALRGTDADVLHITPYRSFPSDISASPAKRHEYIRWADRPGRYIVEDDVTSEFTPSSKPEETVFSLAGKDNVLYLNTFSQTVSPSLRMGYLVLPVGLLPLFRDKVGFYACTVPVFEQFLLSELLQSGDYERHIRKVRRNLRRQRESV